MVMPISDFNPFPLKSIFILSGLATATELLQPVLLLLIHNIYGV